MAWEANHRANEDEHTNLKTDTEKGQGGFIQLKSSVIRTGLAYLVPCWAGSKKAGARGAGLRGPVALDSYSVPTQPPLQKLNYFSGFLLDVRRGSS